MNDPSTCDFVGHIYHIMALLPKSAYIVPKTTVITMLDFIPG
jgi:hypothetical protein